MKITIRTLTPIHIGEGKILYKNIDFITEGNVIKIIDPDEVVDILYDEGKVELINSIFDDSGNIDRGELIRSGVMNKLKHVRTYTIPGDTHIGQILSLIKDGRDKVFIPGSSIKGAIRTAFLWYCINTANEGLRREIINELIDHKNSRAVFSSDAFSNPLKSIAVVDAYFSSLKQSLAECRVLYMKDNQNVFKSRASIYLEVVDKDSVANGEIRFDKFFYKNNQLGGLKDKLPTDFTGLASIVNSYTRQLIEREIDSLSNEADTSGGREKIYRSLCNSYRQILNSIPRDNRYIVLRFGAGSGWKFMTGDYLGEYELEKVRRREVLGSVLCPRGHKVFSKRDGKPYCRVCRTKYNSNELRLIRPFPKTRKVLIRNGVLQPLGFVRIEAKE